MLTGDAAPGTVHGLFWDLGFPKPFQGMKKAKQMPMQRQELHKVHIHNTYFLFLLFGVSSCEAFKATFRES